MELLFSPIPLPFGVGHITRRQDQSSPILGTNKENDHVPSGVCLPKRHINILSLAVALFNEEKARKVRQDFFDLLRLDPMFLQKFLDDVLKPDQSGDFQGNSP